MLPAHKSLEESFLLTPPSQPRSKRLLTACEIVIWTVALLIPACGGFYRYAYYQQFRQGMCTITDGEVTSQYVSTKTGGYTNYSAHFSYLVIVPGSGGIAAQGYDAPDHMTFSSADEAQKVIDQYPLGSVTTCWYNRNHPSEAALVFHGYSLQRAWTTFVLALLATGFFDLLSILAWYERVHLILTLRDRGRVTKGVVQRREKYQTRTGMSTIALISYTALSVENQRVKGTLRGPGYLCKRERVSVCYDPYRPHKALRGGRPSRTRLVSWMVTALLVLCIISILASLLTYLVS